MKIYELLGLDESAEQSTVEQVYAQKKSELREKSFLPGQEGFAAAKEMDGLESAYKDYVDSFAIPDPSDEPSLDKVDGLIKKGLIEDAQKMLDQIGVRNGEWHYFQALIFYKREWLLKCRKNLVIAVGMDPENPKYRATLQKLDQQTMQNQFAGNGRPMGGNQYHNPRRNSMVDCCCAYCFAELCCNICAHC